MKKYRFLILVSIAISFQTGVNAASADTISVYSKALHKNSKCVIIISLQTDNI